MTIINNNGLVINTLKITAAPADKTRVEIDKAPAVFKNADNLSVKANFGVVPASKEIEFEKKESNSASVTKVIAELVSTGLNLTVKARPKAVISASEKIGVEVVAKTGGTVAAFVGKAMPNVVMAINVGITVHDAHDSYVKLTDKNTSFSSKAFSVSTVGLDLVTVVTHHAGYGKVAAAASLASIGTSLASDYLRDDK